MNFLGIDIGSRNIKAVLIGDDGNILDLKVTETSYAPLEKCFDIINKFDTKLILATGYGRHLVGINHNIPTITEIKAFAIGAKALVPNCRSVIDIGGQDTKVISLDALGGIKKFEMNDRCAAGTGRFLEVMANVLGYSVEEFGAIEGKTGSSASISSMCTVFAESEVISLIAKGISREAIGVAVHRAISKRVASIAKRNSLEEDIVFAGGCAGNRLLKNLLEGELGKRLIVPEAYQFLGAYGAALHAKSIY